MKRKSSILSQGIIYAIILLILILLVVYFRDADRWIIILLTVVVVLTVLGGSVYFVFRLVIPLQDLSIKLSRLSRGEKIQQKIRSDSLEFDKIENALNIHIQHIEEITRVADRLACGDLESGYKPLGPEDELGLSLERLEKSIISSRKEVAERRERDEQQKWASQGLAKFVELLRDFGQYPEELSSRFIKELVDYLNMEVGGFFLHQYDKDNNSVYVLKGAYAFDREKYLSSEFHLGEGLVGRCAVEKATIYITDVPKDYIRIRSGLGEDTPSTLIFVPVILDNLSIAIIELAGFSPVEKYKIEFLESLGLSIATSISKS